MKIAKKDLALIMIIVGILAAFCSYKFYLSNKLTEVENEKTKQASLQSEIDRLKKVAGTEPVMKGDIQRWEKELATMVDKYKMTAVKYEDGILYFNKLEQDLKVPVTNFNIAETGYSNVISGQGSFSGKNYAKGSTTYTFSYTAENYDALKTFINYLVSGEQGIKTIETISFNVGNVTISGNVTITVYVMTDGAIEYEPPVIDGVETGKLENIFQQGQEEK